MSGDDALDLLAGLVLEDGRHWGEAAHDFQWDDARAVLSADPDAPPYHFLTRPRGGSKTTDLGGVALAALLCQLPAGGRGYAVAADRDQARLLVDALAGFVDRSDLGDAVRVEQWRVTALASGATLSVLAADGPSAYGLRPHLVIVDELAQWPDTPGPRTVWEAVVSAAPKVPGCRLVVLTSAGTPDHWSYGVRGHAADQPRWRLHEVPGPCPWIDDDALAEQRALLTESQYARLHLNRWTSADDRLATLDGLRAAVTHDGPLPPRRGRRYVIGLDVGLTDDRTAAAVCHPEDAGDPTALPRVVVDRLQVWRGSRDRPVRLTEVEEWLRTAAGDYRAPVVFDPYQAVGMAQRLAGTGVDARQFSFTAQSVGRLAGTLHRLVRDGALGLPDDPDLLDELAGVRLVERSPGVVRLDHDAGRHDDRAIAIALAAHELVDRGPTTVRVRAYSVQTRGGVHGALDFGDAARVEPDPAEERMLARCRSHHERGDRPETWADAEDGYRDAIARVRGNPTPGRRGRSR